MEHSRGIPYRKSLGEWDSPSKEKLEKSQIGATEKRLAQAHLIYIMRAISHFFDLTSA